MLRYLRYVLMWLGIVFILFVVICYYYVQAGGKLFIEKRFSIFFQQPATIGEIRFLLPLGLRFKNLQIQNFIKAEDVQLQVGMPFVFDKRLVIQKLVLKHPVFTGVYDEHKKFQFGGAYLAQREKSLREGSSSEAPFFEGMRIEYFEVKDGEVEILNFSKNPSERYFFDQIQLKALDVSYPLLDQRVKFDVKAFIQKGFGLFDRGVFTSEGWVNWPKRSLSSKVDFVDDRQFSRIQIDAKSENNDLKVAGSAQWDASRLDQVEKADIQKAGGDFAGGLAVGVLSLAKGEQTFQFDFSTKLDDSQLSTINLSGAINLNVPPFEKSEEPVALKPFEIFSGAAVKGK